MHEFSFHIAAAFRSYLLLACGIVYTLRTLSVEQMSWAGLLLAGPGHLKSSLIAIITSPVLQNTRADERRSQAPPKNTKFIQAPSNPVQQLFLLHIQKPLKHWTSWNM